MLLIEKPLDGVAVVTLNRPEAMNALSKALRAALSRAITELDQDPAVRVIILTGAGERAFTAGLDLKELSTDPLGMGAANATSAAVVAKVAPRRSASKAMPKGGSQLPIIITADNKIRPSDFKFQTISKWPE